MLAKVFLFFFCETEVVRINNDSGVSSSNVYLSFRYVCVKWYNSFLFIFLAEHKVFWIFFSTEGNFSTILFV